MRKILHFLTCSKEDNQQIRGARIKEISEAALRVYMHKGFLGTQMEDVAKQAGLAKGLLYYYFKTKVELFQYVFAQLMNRALESTEAMADKSVPIAETLEQMVKFFVYSAYENPLYPLAYKMMDEDLDKVFARLWIVSCCNAQIESARLK